MDFGEYDSGKSKATRTLVRELQATIRTLPDQTFAISQEQKELLSHTGQRAEFWASELA